MPALRVIGFPTNDEIRLRMVEAKLAQSVALCSQLAAALREHAPNHELLGSVFLPRGFEVGE